MTLFLQLCLVARGSLPIQAQSTITPRDIEFHHIGSSTCSFLGFHISGQIAGLAQGSTEVDQAQVGTMCLCHEEKATSAQREEDPCGLN